MKVKDLQKLLEVADAELEVVLFYETLPVITEAEVFEDDDKTVFLLTAEALL